MPRFHYHDLDGVRVGQTQYTVDDEFQAEAAVLLETALAPVVQGVDFSQPIDTVLQQVKANVTKLVDAGTPTPTPAMEAAVAQQRQLLVRLCVAAFWSIIFVRGGQVLRPPT